MRKNTVQKVKGVVCTNWCGDHWEFGLVAGVRWDYDRCGHSLWCKGELVAGGVMCLGDAVLVAQGYEMGVADMGAKSRAVEQASHKEGIARGEEQYQDKATGTGL